MKNHILFSFLIFTSGLFSAIEHSPLRARLFTAENSCTPALRSLLKVAGIECNETLPELVKATQAKWLRAAGKERWEVEDTFKAHEQEIFTAADDLHMRRTIYPEKKSYDYVIVLGATIKAVESRLNFLKELVTKHGLHIGKIVLLAGQRDLTDQEMENLKEMRIYASHMTSETEMVRALIESKQFADLRVSDYVVIDTPKQKANDGSLRRPNTADTIACWMETEPKPGSVLAISGQPFVGYQDAALRTYLPSSFTLETVGNADNRGKTASLYLDTLARWLYQELQRQNKLAEQGK